jgi:hypothetical protein
MNIKYERAGIYIEYNEEGAVFKKNGLTIEIPGHILQDFEQEFELKQMEIIRQYYQEMPEEDKYLVENRAKETYKHTKWHEGSLYVSDDEMHWMLWGGIR